MCMCVCIYIIETYVVKFKQIANGFREASAAPNIRNDALSVGRIRVRSHVRHILEQNKRCLWRCCCCCCCWTMLLLLYCCCCCYYNDQKASGHCVIEQQYLRPAIYYIHTETCRRAACKVVFRHPSASSLLTLPSAI